MSKSLKLFLFLIISILMLPIYVEAETYKIEKVNLTFELDDSWIVFTVDNLESNDNVVNSGFTKEALEQLFEENNAYFEALEAEGDGKLFLRVNGNQANNNIADFTDSNLKELAKSIGNKVDADKTSIYKNKYNYVVAEYKDGDYNILSYYTIVNNQSYNFSYQLIGNITDSKKDEIEKIISKVNINVDSNFGKKENDFTLYGVILLGAMALLGVTTNIIKRKKIKVRN